MRALGQLYPLLLLWIQSCVSLPQLGSAVAHRGHHHHGAPYLGWIHKKLPAAAERGTCWKHSATLARLVTTAGIAAGKAATIAAATAGGKASLRAAAHPEESGGAEATGLSEQGGSLSNQAQQHTNPSPTPLNRKGRYLRICMVGRPNVGKSTLFNRICTGRPLGGPHGGSLVSQTAGTTRDCLISRAEWGGRVFEVADTGGLLMDDADLGPLASELRDQVAFAMQQAACVVLVVDSRVGVQSDDEFMADMVRHLKVPVVVCVNKCENPKTAAADAQVFWRLGLGEPIPCSAVTGSGVSELLDRCLEHLPSPSASTTCFSLRIQGDPKAGLPEHIRVAVIGRPNAGKSRLINRLLNAQRSIVSPLPGTTRDAVDEFISRGDAVYCLVDTAGIRRASVIRRSSETDLHMVARAKMAAARADVCLLVIDGKAGLTHQDVHLAKMLEAYGRAVVVIINKWDVALQTDQFKHSEAVDYVRKVLYPLVWADVLFVSAETGQGVSKIWPAVDAAAQQHRRRLTTGLLNFVVRDAIGVFPPPLTKDGKRGKIYLVQQVATQPPTIVVFCNKGEYFPDAYRRYLDFSVRSAFHFSSTPIRWIFRDKRLRSMEQLMRQRKATTNLRRKRRPTR